ncbi:hypothetical protein PoB_004477500 [Plakobranchus ocellatus]|uniref:Uncharacterized protein n=1 Tax=Plakobranchus ocellatus TaxID=259542 RepID=A0AAV4BGQ4_9GAST|nr:hypothetical protein PoB_004477500 [Plakobranchus ocellatus]
MRGGGRRRSTQLDSGQWTVSAISWMMADKITDTISVTKSRDFRREMIANEDDLISELRNWFDNLDVDFFRVGIHSLLPRRQKCIDLHGDNVEK